MSNEFFIIANLAAIAAGGFGSYRQKLPIWIGILISAVLVAVPVLIEESYPNLVWGGLVAGIISFIAVASALKIDRSAAIGVFKYVILTIFLAAILAQSFSSNF